MLGTKGENRDSPPCDPPSRKVIELDRLSVNYVKICDQTYPGFHPNAALDYHAGVFSRTFSARQPF